MTEMETLERAKMYIEKLANGINPIDDTVIPDEDVVNNVRLSRCFFYVADVLRQVIDNGGIAKKKKTSKEAFSLSPEQREAFEFSDEPISISEIVKRANKLIPDNTTKLKYSVICEWLLSLGILQEISDENHKNAKRPTEQGKSIGITVEERVGSRGTYKVVVYDLAAQHFIIDNIDAVTELGNDKCENKWAIWSAEHDRCLLDLHKKGVPIKEIAITLKRSSGAVRSRLKTIGAE